MTSPSSPDAVSRFLEARIADGWMPSAAWWIEARGRVASRGALGSAALEPVRALATEATPYDLASLTKPLVTALLLAKLEDDGIVEAATGVERWLEETRGTPLGAVSLLDLARHESGLPAWRPIYLFAHDRSSYLACIAREARRERHGETQYSDLGYIVLGAALERAAGAALDVLFERRVARPLGLAHCGFAVAGRSFEDAAATERGNGYEYELAGSPSMEHAWRTRMLRGQVHDGNAWGLGGTAGHAGLFATVDDVATLGREVLGPGVLGLGRKTRERMLAAPRPGARTAGFVPAEQSQAARGILPPATPGHTGFTGVSVWLDPATQGIYVLLTNRVHPSVPSRNFQWLRRAFHRLASAATAAD